MIPSVDSLRCFCAAAKLLNFRAAARTVFLTPQAFGERVRQLEDNLGARLFERTTRRVQLTSEGLRLLPTAERALRALADCEKALVHSEGMPRTELVLGTRHELGLSWVEPQLETLAKKLPWLELNLYFGSGADLLHRVRTLEIDCAVTSSRLDDARLDFFRLHREEYVFVGSPALLRQKPLTRPEHAASHVLLDIDNTLPLFRYWREAPELEDELRFLKVRRFGTTEAIRRRVLANDGVAVLPLYLVQPDLRARRLVKLLPKVAPRSDFFRLVYRADDPRRSLLEELANALLESPLR